MSLRSFADKSEPVAFDGSTVQTKGGGGHSGRGLFRRRFMTARGNTQRSTHAPPSMTSSDQSGTELDVDDMSSRSPFADKPEPVLDGHHSDPFAFEGSVFSIKEEENHNRKRRKIFRRNFLATRDNTRQNTYARLPMTSSDPLGMVCVDVDTAIATHDNWMHTQRVLSLSLFGDDSDRRQGAVDLLDRIPVGWDVVFYVDSSIDDVLRAQLVKKKAHVKDVTHIGVRGQYRAMWRFLEILRSHKHGGRLVAIGDVDPKGHERLIGFLNKLSSQYEPGNHPYVVTMSPDWSHGYLPKMDIGAIAVYDIPDWLHSSIETKQHLMKTMTRGEVPKDNKHEYQWLSDYIKVLGIMRVPMHHLAPGSQRMCVIPKGDTPNDREWQGPVEFRLEAPKKNTDIVECLLHHWYAMDNNQIGDVMLRLIQVHLVPTGFLNCIDDNSSSSHIAVAVPTIRIKRDDHGALRRLELIEAGKGSYTHALWHAQNRQHTKADKMGLLLFVAMTNLSVSLYRRWLIGNLRVREFADKRGLPAQGINGEQTSPLLNRSPDFKSAWRHMESIFLGRFGLFAEFYTWVALLVIFFPCWRYDNKGESYDNGVMVTHFDMSHPKSSVIVETTAHRLMTLCRRNGDIAPNAPTNTRIAIGIQYMEDVLRKGKNLVLLAYQEGSVHGMLVCRTDIGNVIDDIRGEYKLQHVNTIRNSVIGRKSIFVSLLCGVKCGTKLVQYLRDNLNYEFIFLEAVDDALKYWRDKVGLTVLQKNGLTLMCGTL